MAIDDQFDAEFDDIEWEEVFFDGDLFVSDQRSNDRQGVQVKVAFSHETGRFRALSHDISPGGLFIATGRALPVDAEFKLVFKLPTADEPVRAIARVAWVRDEPDDESGEPAGFGVEFVELTDQGRASIDQFLALRSALLEESPESTSG
jgi:uncharacterized protein (TIGR02266 family)